MSLTILNNISDLTAENALSNTQSSLQKTLTQLSTGLKINSGSDDAAGLSIANGMQANIAALTQSQQNASDGIGMLQTADGALSQVTTMLNRAVTLATEASNSTLNTSGSQATALNTEYQSILQNINTIGSDTEFNGQQVFSNTDMNIAMSDGTSTGNMSLSSIAVGTLTTQGLGLSSTGSATISASAAPVANDTVKVGGQTYKFVVASSISADSATANEVAIGSTGAQSLQNLADAINGVASGSGTEYTAATTANGNVTAGTVNGSELTVTAANASVSGANLDVAVSNSSGGALSMVNGATHLSNTTAGTSNLSIVDNPGDADTVTIGATQYTFISQANWAADGSGTADAVEIGNTAADTAANLANAINASSGGGYGTGTTANASATAVASNNIIALTATGLDPASTTLSSTTAESGAISFSSSSLQSVQSNLSDLSNTTDAAAALNQLTTAISLVAAQRGTVGAGINQLTSLNNVMNTQVQNLQSADNSIMDADIGTTVANMTQYNVLESTGMAALQQSNQAQQAVLKLVQ